ncbi:hypothetical protein [Lacihabitans soyangensis]|uniref:Uncharacterized protein n=1 Tax=Lacihabitans soyangensis TaxID=869394 RepID=A0AAE3H482_9BACT|nr:hypothetical protein [Lacihabitans soyangensis]MCP9763910.1 hypothetical protein [Lacihabitans soyangensis]
MENLNLGYTKTVLGTFKVIPNNATEIINNQIEKANAFLKGKGIIGDLVGHNMLHKRKNENIIVHYSNGNIRFSVNLAKKTILFNLNVKEVEFEINKNLMVSVQFGNEFKKKYFHINEFAKIFPAFIEIGRNRNGVFIEPRNNNNVEKEIYPA